MFCRRWSWQKAFQQKKSAKCVCLWQLRSGGLSRCSELCPTTSCRSPPQSWPLRLYWTWPFLMVKVHLTNMESMYTSTFAFRCGWFTHLFKAFILYSNCRKKESRSDRKAEKRERKLKVLAWTNEVTQAHTQRMQTTICGGFNSENLSIDLDWAGQFEWKWLLQISTFFQFATRCMKWKAHVLLKCLLLTRLHMCNVLNHYSCDWWGGGKSEMCVFFSYVNISVQGHAKSPQISVLCNKLDV